MPLPSHNGASRAASALRIMGSTFTLRRGRPWLATALAAALSGVLSPAVVFGEGGYGSGIDAAAARYMTYWSRTTEATKGACDGGCDAHFSAFTSPPPAMNILYVKVEKAASSTTGPCVGSRPPRDRIALAKRCCNGRCSMYPSWDCAANCTEERTWKLECHKLLYTAAHSMEQSHAATQDR
eukprot:scaffold101_cov373-Prasinococcus_capsulatus_cf.AAC.10